MLFQPARAGCWARHEDECIEQKGCSWFSIHWGADGCPLCEKLFGIQDSLTGCRDWDFFSFCDALVASPAAEKYKAMGGDVTSVEFREAISHYELSYGWRDGDHLVRKQAACNYWCDMSPPYSCNGQARARNEIRGINYGSRFIPEAYLHLPRYHDLTRCVWVPAQTGSAQRSLCDVAGYPDSGARIKEYMDVNIKLEHFQKMTDAGFDTIRLPLGYWNLVEDVGAPDCPQAKFNPDACPNSWRQRKLTTLLPVKEYTDRIDKIFRFARHYGMTVMLDLHGAPGGQTHKVNTGCATDGVSGFYFDTQVNKDVAVRAIEAMALICKRWGKTCWGMELLNEPAGIGGPDAPWDAQLDRWSLKDFYEHAIWVSRKHLPQDKPLVINEWPQWLKWWKQYQPFNYKQHGRIVFSTHLYHIHKSVVDQAASRAQYKDDLDLVAKFHWGTKYDFMVSEYALSGHDSACGASGFDYNSFLNWFVNQCNQHGIGSMLWNFDGRSGFWGPVEHNNIDGRAISWQWIFPKTPRATVVTTQHHSLTWPKYQPMRPPKCFESPRDKALRNRAIKKRWFNQMLSIVRSGAGIVAEPEAFADAAVKAVHHASAQRGHWEPRQLAYGICSAVGKVAEERLASRSRSKAAEFTIHATYRAMVLQDAAQKNLKTNQKHAKLKKAKPKMERRNHKLQKLGEAHEKNGERAQRKEHSKQGEVEMPDKYREVLARLRAFYTRDPVYT